MFRPSPSSSAGLPVSRHDSWRRLCGNRRDTRLDWHSPRGIRHRRCRSRNGQQHQLPAADHRRFRPWQRGRDTQGSDKLGLGRRDARRSGPAVCNGTCHDCSATASRAALVLECRRPPDLRRPNRPRLPAAWTCALLAGHHEAKAAAPRRSTAPSHKECFTPPLSEPILQHHALKLPDLKGRCQYADSAKRERTTVLHRRVPRKTQRCPSSDHLRSGVRGMDARRVDGRPAYVIESHSRHRRRGRNHRGGRVDPLCMALRPSLGGSAPPVVMTSPEKSASGTR